MGKARPPTSAQRRRWTRVAQLGCMTPGCYRSLRITIHHCGTGAGGRKNHDKVVPLCWEHHLGDEGINSLTGKISRSDWEEKYITEKEMLEQVAVGLGEV